MELVNRGWEVRIVSKDKLLLSNFHYDLVISPNVYDTGFWERDIPYEENLMILDIADAVFEDGIFKSKMIKMLRDKVVARFTYELLESDIEIDNISIYEDEVFVSVKDSDVNAVLDLRVFSMRYSRMDAAANAIEKVFHKVMESYHFW